MRPSSIWYLAHPLRLSHPGGKSLFPKELTKLCEAPLQEAMEGSRTERGYRTHLQQSLGKWAPQNTEENPECLALLHQNQTLFMWHVSVFKERKCKVLIFIKCMQRF